MKHLLIISILAFVLLAPFSGQEAYAQSSAAKDKFNAGLKTTADETGHTQLKLFKEADSLPATIGAIIQLLLSFLGIFFLLLTIYGGFLWMTARGNDAQTAKARNILQNAIIGLIIILVAYGLTAFVTAIVVDKFV